MTRTSEEFGREHEAILRQIRRDHVFPHSERYGGFWISADYETVRAVLANEETFSVATQPDRTGAC